MITHNDVSLVRLQKKTSTSLHIIVCFQPDSGGYFTLSGAEKASCATPNSPCLTQPATSTKENTSKK
jgi:hypothetical protein